MVDILFVRVFGVKAAVQLKRGMAGAGVLCIIISEFRHWEKLSLVVLLIVDKSLEKGLYCTILPFCLPVSLGVKGGRESALDA